MWNEGFSSLDAVHHQSGNYLVEIDENGANVFTSSIASHYKKDAFEGPVREFIGDYDLHLINTDNGWRVDKFKYNLKYMTGNIELK